MKMNGPYLIDTTLRDGEQTPGVAFSVRDKIRIATALDELGVEEVEAGTPAIGREEQEAIKHIARAGFSFVTSCWCRARIQDIKEAASLGVQSLNISLPVSSIQINALGKSDAWVMDTLKEVMGLASGTFPFVTMGAQDASRADPDFLLEFMMAAEFYGAGRIRINDTVGILDPFETHDLIAGLHAAMPAMELEFHGHNDLGMATANSLAALRGGARCVSATLNGIGERAGNAALEEIMASLKYKNNLDRYRYAGLHHACSLVSMLSHMPVAGNKAVTGGNAFRHESGIHTAALIRDRQTYQFMDPREFGMHAPGFHFGKHSGCASLQHYFREAGLPINRVQSERVLANIKERVYRTGRSIRDGELIDIYQKESYGHQ